jgi:CRP/FNR family transcriptional regulator
MDKRELVELHVLVEHVGPFIPAITCSARATRSKRSLRSARARSRRTSWTPKAASTCSGFTCQARSSGSTAIDGEHYPCNAVALDTVALCRFSFPRMAELAARVPGLQQQLFRLLSRDIGTALRLAGALVRRPAPGAFLLGLSRRLASARILAAAIPTDRWRAPTSAINLRLAPETVSRVLKRFHRRRPGHGRTAGSRALRHRPASKRSLRRSCKTDSA